MRMRGDLIQPFFYEVLGICLVFAWYQLQPSPFFPSGDASRASRSHLSLFSHATKSGRARLVLASLVGTCCFIVAKISVLASML